MAVVEKKPDTRSSTKPMPLPIAGILGAIYVIAALSAIFVGLPWLWQQVGFTQATLAASAGRAAAAIAAVIILFVVGGKLLGSRPRPGVKAAVFTTLFLAFVWLMLARLFGGWLQSWTYDGWLSGLGTTTGMGIFAVISVLLAYWFVKMLFRPTFPKKMENFEKQGWFNFGAYKPGQGLRVRRGTMLGIMLVAGAGIWVMVNRSLDKGNWEVNIPFTAEAVITEPGDAIYLADLDENTKAQLQRTAGDKAETWVITRAELRDLNAKLSPGVSRRVKDAELFDDYGIKGLAEKYQFKKDQIVTKRQWDEAVKAIKDLEQDRRGERLSSDESHEIEWELRLAAPVTKEITSNVQYASILLLPDVQYTLPLLLIVLTLWFAWRVINLPVFADFLIATEAEINKVSWTTRSRLYQDTIVVLSTLIILAVFFFVVDNVWFQVLKWKPIGVLKIPENQGQRPADVEDLKW